MSSFRDLKEKIVSFAQEKAERLGDKANEFVSEIEQKKEQYELDKLKPVYANIENDFPCPKLINITKPDRAHEKYEGSIGWWQSTKGFDVLNLYEKNAKIKSLQYLPNLSLDNVYCQNPINRYSYISVSDFYKYIIKEKFAELENIAVKLGAKFLQIDYVEKQNKLNKIGFGAHMKGEADIKDTARPVEINVIANGSHDSYDKFSTDVSIALKEELPGNTVCERPVLNWWKHEQLIKNLIEKRMIKEYNAKTVMFSIEQINSSEMSKNDAIKIDAAINQLRFNLDYKFTHVLEEKQRKSLRIKIEF